MKKNSYQTADLNLSAYLIASGIKLQSHTKVNGQTLFCFNDTGELKTLVEKYFNFDGFINPQRFTGAVRSLKNIIYDDKDNENMYHGTSVYNK
jgi:hypothetical protein